MLKREKSLIIKIIVAVVAIITIAVPFSSKVAAAETIPDSELAALYGGCGGWFYNPYCVRSSVSCPSQTPCELHLQKCRLCAADSGTVCKDRHSYIPDFDGCDNDSVPCQNRPLGPGAETNKGYCVYPGFETGCEMDPWPEGEYPNCDFMSRPVCDD